MSWLPRSVRVACGLVVLWSTVPVMARADEETATSEAETLVVVEESDGADAVEVEVVAEESEVVVEEGARSEAQVVTEEVPEAEPTESLQQDVTTANNPLAFLRAVQLHNYYFPRLSGIPGESGNTLFLRAVMPFWRIIPRLSIPFLVRPAPNPTDTVAKVSGIGDLTLFVTFVVTPTRSKGILGIGPLYTAPTASNPAIGRKKHQVGAAAIGLYAKGILLVGGIFTYRIGVAGDPNRPRTQSIAVQPAAFIQIGHGFYLRTAPIWFFDLEQPSYNVPFGLGAGKVIPTDKIVYNLFVEPQFAVALRGIGQPAVQIYVGMNMQIRPHRKKKRDRARHLVNQLRAEHALRSRMQ